MSGRPERRADSGVVAVLSVFFVLLLLTILAVAINLGRLMQSRGDLQHSADSAALAGVGSLELKAVGGPSPGRSPADFDGTAPSSQGLAQAIGQRYLIGSGVAQNPTVSTSSDIEYGFWHLRTGDDCIFGPGACATGWEAAPPVATLAANGIQMFAVNAVRVKTHYNLATYFDGVLN